MQVGAVFAKAGKGQLYYNGSIVRTIVPSGKPLTKPGTDPLYVFATGVTNQYSITQYAPGDKEYRRGHWAVYVVTWNVAPYPVTSYSALITAQTAGDVTIARNEAADVICPVLPGKAMW